MDRRKFLKYCVKSSTIAIQAGAFCKLGKLIADDSITQNSSKSIFIYDIYAMALYFDGSIGPRTGIVSASDIITGADLHYTFWHGHNGKYHEFTVGSEVLQKLKQGQKVFVNTSTVEQHSHRLFIDPIDIRYRVPGANPVEIEL